MNTDLDEFILAMTRQLERLSRTAPGLGAGHYLRMANAVGKWSGNEMNADLDKCLCCGQTVEEPGPPITPEKAEAAFALFTALGLTRDELITKHRAQLDYQAPGFVAWLEGH